jgi:Fe-S-cluster containining protein
MVYQASSMTDFESVKISYGNLLQQVDLWFARCMAVCGTAIACGKGCSSCCRGLFDITLLDAWYLRQGFERLPVQTQNEVRSRITRQLCTLSSVWQNMAEPYILNIIPGDEWERLMPEDDETPCPLLGKNGSCLVYDNRPMTCRLHGIPLIDSSGEIFHDAWCTKNFINDDPLLCNQLRWEFKRCFEKELSIFQEFTQCLFDQKINELDTFIPTALLINFEKTDWKTWWLENHDKLKR